MNVFRISIEDRVPQLNNSQCRITIVFLSDEQKSICRDLCVFIFRFDQSRNQPIFNKIYFANDEIVSVDSSIHQDRIDWLSHDFQFGPLDFAHSTPKLFSHLHECVMPIQDYHAVQNRLTPKTYIEFVSFVESVIGGAQTLKVCYDLLNVNEQSPIHLETILNVNRIDDVDEFLNANQVFILYNKMHKILLISFSDKQ